MIYDTEYLAKRRNLQNKKLITNWNISNDSMLELSKFGWIKEDDIMVPIHGTVYVVPPHCAFTTCGVWLQVKGSM